MPEHEPTDAPEAEGEVAPDGVAHDATPLCPNCLTEASPHQQFCGKCGMPIGAFATYDPFKQIFATGWMYRRASTKGTPLLGLIGMWMILGPIAVLGALGWLFAVIGPRRPGAMNLLLGGIIPMLSALVLWKSTRNYLRSPRTIAGHCEKCGYDLRRLPESRCPECGTPFDPSAIEDDDFDELGSASEGSRR